MIIVNPSAHHVSNSSLPEADHPLYDVSTNYALDDMVSHNGVNYKCTVEGTQGIEPAADSPNWSDQGAVNRLKAFDGGLNTASEATDILNYTINATGLINAIALLRLDASQVEVVVTNAQDQEVYRKNVKTAAVGVTNLKDYLLTGYSRIKDVVLLDIPSVVNSTIQINITGSNINLGMVVMGYKKTIGSTQNGFASGIRDFSKTVRDKNTGHVELKQGNFFKKRRLNMRIERSQYSSVERYLTDIRATPSLYIVSQNDADIYVFGYYTNFNLVGTNSKVAFCSINLEGLI